MITLDLESPKPVAATTMERQIAALEIVLSCLKFNHREFELLGTMFQGADTPLRINRARLEAKLRELRHDPEPLSPQSATLDMRTPHEKSRATATVPAGTNVIGTSVVFGERRDVRHSVRG